MYLVDSLYSFRWLKHGRNDIQNKLLSSLPVQFRDSLKGATNDDAAKKIISDFLSENLEGRKAKYSLIGKEMELSWVKQGHVIEKKLQKLYDNPVPFKTLKIYLSSLPICPYNYEKGWIMVFAGTKVERRLQILTHELNHFMFYYYFGYLRKELGKEKFESLKEALTIFTNPEEKGYPAQQKLRTWLAKQKGSIPTIIESRGWKKYL